METKRKHNGIFYLKAAVLGFSLFLLMGMTAHAKTNKWTSSDSQWYDRNSNVYYITGDTLYVSPVAPHSMGIMDKVVSWKKGDEDYLKIVNGYGNNLYVNQITEMGDSVLYSVNVKNHKKTKISGKCYIAASSGKYMYGDTEKPMDTGAYPVYVWKISGNSVKKVKTLGKFIFGTTVVNNKVYYASYPDRSQKKMTVYSCNLNGSSRKKLFQLEGQGDFCQVLISDVTEETITAYVSGDKPGNYVYTIKTGKLKKQ